VTWGYWANGWTTSIAAGIPANVNGFLSYGKKSWMTETSGETPTWLDPSTGFPSNGGWSIALKIHQALTVGRQSAWLYWQTSDGNPVSSQTLLDSTTNTSAPKYVAVKHYFSLIRPNSVALNTTADQSALLSSSYINDADATLTIVLINSNATSISAVINVPSSPTGLSSFNIYTSSNNNYWQTSTASVNQQTITVTVPGYAIVSLQGQGTSQGSTGSSGSSSSQVTGSSSKTSSSSQGSGTGSSNTPTGSNGVSTEHSSSFKVIISMMLILLLISM